MRTPRSLVVFLSLIALAMPTVVHAQGLTADVTGTIVPNSQGAAVDDAWALFVNPAGIAFVDSFQLVGSYTGTANLSAVTGHRLSSGAVFAPGGGFSFGSGMTVMAVAGSRAPVVVPTGAFALRVDRMVAFGAQVHGIVPLTPGAGTRLVGDVGVQIRPVSFLALGLSLHSLGALHIDDRTSVRAGVSVRPFGKYLTVGTDVRVIAGSTDPLSPSTYAGATIVPGALARLQLLGVGLSLGATVTDLSLRATTAPGFTVGASLDVNTSHLGALLLGDVSSALGAQAGAGFRISAEEFESVLPNRREWLSFSLAGDGVPVADAGNIIEELLAASVHPISVLAGLERASRDDAVEGVVIHLAGLSVGWGRAHELREALLLLRSKGKKVVVHMDGGDDSDVYLASAADKVFLSPAGGLSLDGLAMTMTYAARALERFGVRAIAITAGDYKSAPRSFTADGPNAAELEVQNAILDITFDLLVTKIAEGRGLTTTEVKRIIDMGGLTADEAKSTKIVDALGYWGDIPKLIENEFEGSGKPLLRTDYLEDNTRKDRWRDPPRIAVIPIIGDITMGSGGGSPLGIFGGGGAGSDVVIAAIQKAKDDSDIDAVVLRIDSPGGDAVASDLIWHAVMELREEKPVVASMGDVAASGGYYIAAGAKEIFAEPSTITGSIGVFALMFNAEQLANDVGITSVELSRGALPPASLLRAPGAEETARLEAQIDWMYERFLSAIKEGRGMPDEKLRPLAGGRVWTGVEARERGLVDHLGGIDAALARARELANLDADDEFEVAILSGEDEIVPRFSSAVRVLAGANADEERIKKAVRLLLGDDVGMALAASEGRPLAATPVRYRVE
jgi:protease-4